MVSIRNEYLSLSLDEKGHLVELANHKAGGGNIIARPVPLFHTILQNGNNWEEVAYADNAELTVSATGQQAFIRVSALNTRQSHFEMEITLTLSLVGERVLFDAEIVNPTDATVTDFFYPCIGGIRSLGAGAPSLLYPAGYGELHTDIIRELQTRVGRDTIMLLSGIYPFTLSMQCMMLTDAEYCLYLAAQDPQFHIHSMLAQGSEAGDVTLKMDKMIFVRPGQRWKNPQYTLWLYRGTWQQGAEAYRAWADTQLQPSRPQPWLAESNGMMTAVGKQTYGAETWRYDQIPTLYATAERHGCDVLNFRGGFYSDHRDLTETLAPIPTMGGEQVLRDAIAAVHEQGGHVILHYPGHKMELNSPHYPALGLRLASKNHWGNPHHEQYSSTASSEFLRMFGERSAAAICPGCTEWQELLVEKSRQLHALGADGAIFDEVGGFQHYVHRQIAAMIPYPCFDPAHHHEDPSSAYAEGRRALLARLRGEADGMRDFSLLCEGIGDLFAPYVDTVRGNASHNSNSERDCAHNGGASPDAKGRRAVARSVNKSMILNMPEFFRHTFPEVISTVANASPYLQPRMANYALCYGFRFALELRTQRDKEFIEREAYPDWQAYARAVCTLRKTYADLLLKGRYTCDADLAAGNPALNHGLFTAGEKACIVFWNDTDDTLPLNLCGMTVSHWVGIDINGEGAPAEIAGNSVLVMFLDGNGV